MRHCRINTLFSKGIDGRKKEGRSS